MNTGGQVVSFWGSVLVMLALVGLIIGALGCMPKLDAAEEAFRLIRWQRAFGVGTVPPELWAESQALIKVYRASADQAERARITWRLLEIKAAVCPAMNKGGGDDE